MELRKIGTIETDERSFYLQLEAPYRDGLIGLDGFSHVQVVWWADQLDSDDMRSKCTVEKPYRPGPDLVGIFATRSPMRPNPICTTVIAVTDINAEEGTLHTWYIDGAPGTPILDIKPYLPCSDRPANPEFPEWSAVLPDTIEASAEYDWESYFNF